MGRAAHWSKFTATASVGLIHNKHLSDSMNILSRYLSGSGGGPYQEGGALYALGFNSVEGLLGHLDDDDDNSVEGILGHLDDEDHHTNNIIPPPIPIPINRYSFIILYPCTQPIINNI